MQHLPFTQLIGHRQARVSQHLAQPLQTLGKDSRRQLEKEVSGAFSRAGVELSAMALNVGHQVFVGRKALRPEKEQVLKKVRQPWPLFRHIMTARRDPQRRRAASKARRRTQRHTQAVGKGQ